MNRDEKIFLFDMDGTLTPPRERVQGHVIKAMKKLSEHGRIGIVTGSDFEYVWQQMSAAFELGGVPVDNVDLLPCNGTKKYTTNKSRSFCLVHEADMIKEISEDSYNEILRCCVGWQWQIMVNFKHLPYTGTFLQYRGSLLNWCPIGRSADSESRRAWINQDKEKNIRKMYAELFSEKVRLENIAVNVALGGSTSLDIYPAGWDKTYALKHYEGKEVYFVGDRCEMGGNDWHIYEELAKHNRSFSISSPEETVTVIDQLIEGNMC